MFERYTQKARRVIFFARYEASQFGADSIRPEHILIGVLREDRRLADLLNPDGRFSLDVLRKAIMKRVGTSEPVSTSIDMPLSAEAKAALAQAEVEATRMGHRHIATEELFLGLVHDRSSIVCTILNEQRFDVSEVARAVRGRVMGTLEAEKVDEDVSRIVASHLVPRAQWVVGRAQEEARLLRVEAVEPEHLLLGLLLEDRWLIAFFSGRIVSSDTVQSQLPCGKRRVDDVYLSPASAVVIDDAIAAARELGSDAADTEHLLVGLLRSGGRAASFLADWGIDARPMIETLNHDDA